MKNSINRRGLIAAGAASACLAAPVVAQVVNQHPDAAILSAWERYVVVMGAYHDLPDDLTEDDYQPYNDELHRLRTIIVETPARTAEGMAPKLRILFVEKTCCLFVELAMIGRTSPEFERDVAGKQGYDMFMAFIQQCDATTAA